MESDEVFHFWIHFCVLHPRPSRSASTPLRSDSDSSFLTRPVSASDARLCRYPFQTHQNSLERVLKAWWCASDVTAKIGNGLLKAKLPCFDWTWVLNVLSGGPFWGLASSRVPQQGHASPQHPLHPHSRILHDGNKLNPSWFSGFLDCPLNV